MLQIVINFVMTELEEELVKWQVHRLATVIASIMARSPCDQYSYLKDLLLATRVLFKFEDVGSTSFVAEIEGSSRSTAVGVSS